MKLTEQQKRILTELLGEKFESHNWVSIDKENGEDSGTVRCVQCGLITDDELSLGKFPCRVRTFTTDTDMQAVYRAIYKKGMWEDFWKYACLQCSVEIATKEEIDSINLKILDVTLRKVYGRFTSWLFCLSSPSEIEDRMVMAAEWWEQKGERG